MNENDLIVWKKNLASSYENFDAFNSLAITPPLMFTIVIKEIESTPAVTRWTSTTFFGGAFETRDFVGDQHQRTPPPFISVISFLSLETVPADDDQLTPNIIMWSHIRLKGKKKKEKECFWSGKSWVPLLFVSPRDPRFYHRKKFELFFASSTDYSLAVG